MPGESTDITQALYAASRAAQGVGTSMPLRLSMPIRIAAQGVWGIALLDCDLESANDVEGRTHAEHLDEVSISCPGLR